MTWALWRALCAPNFDHPLYQRLAMHRNRLGFGSWQFSFMIGMIGLFFFMVMFAPMLLILMLIASPILYITLTATFFGVLTTVHVSGAVVRERLGERYELLCLTPDGGMGVNWMIYTGRMHQENILEQGLSECWTIVRILLSIAFFMMLGGLLSLSGTPETQAPEATRFVISFAVLLVSLSGAVYLDYVQSILVGGLLGLVIGNITRSLSDARIWSIALFIFQQILVYGVIFLLGLVIAPTIIGLFIRNDLIIGLATPPLVVLALYGIRELMIHGLWRWLTQRLNSDPQQSIPTPFHLSNYRH